MKPSEKPRGEQPGSPQRPTRTTLEHLIKHERGETFEEFVAYAEEFARRHKLTGTLSHRHLLRLVRGHKPDGSPLGPVRTATARLLEQIFGLPVADLLTPNTDRRGDSEAAELRQRLSVSRHIDQEVINLLREQLKSLRRLDRQMGAIVAYPEVRQKLEQVRDLHLHSLKPTIRADLGRLLSELSALAGWEALDRHSIAQAWEHHEHAKQAARDAEAVGLLAHTAAQQAIILSDIGNISTAVTQLEAARGLVKRTGPRLLRAWLAAAHGEGLAVAGHRDDALRAFDVAGSLLPSEAFDPALAFLFLEGAHLERWRGHALARLGDEEAVKVLNHALERLDPTFARAEATLRVDLAMASVAAGDSEGANIHAKHANRLAIEIGSARQRNRMVMLRI
jgi:tetratricopeptide (TPR) repeat protein